MKNYRGEIATLLTLTLVVVGAAATLISSLFVNKTKIASNPRASTVNCVYSTNNQCMGECSTYTTTNCTRCRDGKYRCHGTTDDSVVITTPKPSLTPTRSSSSTTSSGACCQVFTEGKYCPAGQQRIVKYAEAGTDSAANCTSYKATGSTYMPCLQTKYNGTDGCYSTSSGASTPSPTKKVSSSNGGGSSGSTIVGEGQACCFEKNNKIYVYATYESMVNNEMVDENGNVDCERQKAGIERSYKPVTRVFVCNGAAQTGMSVNEYEDLEQSTEEPKVTEIPEKCKEITTRTGFITNNDRSACTSDGNHVVKQIGQKNYCCLQKTLLNNNIEPTIKLSITPTPRRTTSLVCSLFGPNTVDCISPTPTQMFISLCIPVKCNHSNKYYYKKNNLFYINNLCNSSVRYSSEDKIKQTVCISNQNQENTYLPITYTDFSNLDINYSVQNGTFEVDVGALCVPADFSNMLNNQACDTTQGYKLVIKRQGENPECCR